MVDGYHCTMAPWLHGTTAPWYHGTMAQWYHGTMVPWYHGTMAPWYHGTMAPWYHGTMVPWYGIMCGCVPKKEMLLAQSNNLNIARTTIKNTFENFAQNLLGKTINLQAARKNKKV